MPKTLQEKGEAGIKLIDELLSQKPIEFQDVPVGECLYCLFCDDSICKALKKTITGEPRDKDNFPYFCPLKDKPILMRRQEK